MCPGDGRTRMYAEEEEIAMTETLSRSGRSAKVVAAAIVVGLIGSGTLVWQASSAAFTATTDNPGNNWTSGSVALTDNKSGVALFNETNIVPGPSVSKCIEVTYNGTVNADVKLYASATTNALGQYLDFDVELGDGTSCASPGTYTRVYGDADSVLAGDNSDTLKGLVDNHTNWLTGIGGWSPTGAGQTRPFRFTYTLADSSVAAQNQSSTGVRFIWEAQNH
jgi:hypothetical protein